MDRNLEVIGEYNLTRPLSYINYFNTPLDNKISSHCNCYSQEYIYMRSSETKIKQKLLLEKTLSICPWNFKKIEICIKQCEIFKTVNVIQKNKLFKSKHIVTYKCNYDESKLCANLHPMIDTLILLLTDSIVESTINKANINAIDSFWLSREINMMSKYIFFKDYYQMKYIVKLRKYYDDLTKNMNNKKVNNILLALNLHNSLVDRFIVNHPFIFRRQNDNKTDIFMLIINNVHNNNTKLKIEYNLFHNRQFIGEYSYENIIDDPLISILNNIKECDNNIDLSIMISDVIDLGFDFAIKIVKIWSREISNVLNDATLHINDFEMKNLVVTEDILIEYLNTDILTDEIIEENDRIIKKYNINNTNIYNKYHFYPKFIEYIKSREIIEKHNLCAMKDNIKLSAQFKNYLRDHISISEYTYPKIHQNMTISNAAKIHYIRDMHFVDNNNNNKYELLNNDISSKLVDINCIMHDVILESNLYLKIYGRIYDNVLLLGQGNKIKIDMISKYIFDKFIIMFDCDIETMIEIRHDKINTVPYIKIKYVQIETQYDETENFMIECTSDVDTKNEKKNMFLHVNTYVDMDKYIYFGKIDNVDQCANIEKKLKK